jgi:predicted AAA+ superfamily ATPase
MVASWERAVNALRVDLNCDIYLTGSNAKLLSGELATLLAGRYVSILVMPFSFLEVSKALPDLSNKEAFKLFSQLGGMPFLTQLNYQRKESLSYLTDVFSSIVLKDIISRNDFREPEQLERLLRYFLSETGTTFSVSNIANIFAEERRPVSRESIYNYLAAAQDAMLLQRVRRFDVKGKDILRGGEKAYVVDVGLREALLGNNEARIDRVLENIIYLELLRQGFDVFIGKNDRREIDFVARRGADLVYLQVAYLLASEETREREFSAFAGIQDSFPRYVLSLDDIDFSQNGIRHINVIEFLLNGLG